MFVPFLAGEKTVKARTFSPVCKSSNTAVAYCPFEDSLQSFGGDAALSTYGTAAVDMPGKGWLLVKNLTFSAVGYTVGVRHTVVAMFAILVVCPL